MGKIDKISIADFARKPGHYIQLGLPFGLTKHGEIMAWVVRKDMKWYACENCGDNTGNVKKFRWRAPTGNLVWERLILCDKCGHRINERGYQFNTHHIKGEGLRGKIHKYRKERYSSKYDYKVVVKECRDLEEKLGIGKIERKEYLLLRGIREALDAGDKVDIASVAVKAGYAEGKVKELGSAILRQIPDQLFSEMIGVSRRDIHRNLRELIEQRDDTSARIRALELASKITGMSEADGTVKIQVNQGFKLAD